jgi:glycosyltransferase involved in cell wall biosynthesis
VPLRYWALCRTFAAQGHDVIWWSSDFSHLTKSKRTPCPNTDGFSVRLIETPPYTKNISFARLKNHQSFADGFYHEAMAALKSDTLKTPDRIVVSLPPLGVAEQAFRIRDFVNRSTPLQQASSEPTDPTERSLKRRATNSPHQSSAVSQLDCQVIVDIMDAWPETFYQALPKAVRKLLGPILLSPLHRSAQRAYQGADKISAVGLSYLDLASRYLGQTAEGRVQGSDQPSAIQHPPSTTLKPMLLCYHGTDLDRFKLTRSQVASAPDSVPTSTPLSSQPSALKPPASRLRAVYLGAMGSGYDLQTIIDVAARWKAEGNFPFQIHFAGTGSQASQLMTHNSLLMTEERIVFHGCLQNEAITKLLRSADLALVPNRPGSLVACPYKAGEYAAAGLPMLSCLGGELNNLLRQWDAGSEYNEGDAASLQAAFAKYSTDLTLLEQQGRNARKMAAALFDRSETYQHLAEFIIENDE